MVFGDILKKIFGSKHDRALKKLRPQLAQINSLAAKYGEYSDEQLQAMTGEFRQQLASGATLDDILADAFAVVREGAHRVIGLRPYDVQVIGGLILNKGHIAEMKTGEGKTLVATLPAYLNALEGKGVHVVTVNDYLATRDAEWMGQIYRFLGMDVGVIKHGLKNAQRRVAYAADITYGTNNEFGFDFLRDNMKLSVEDMVQRGHNFAIVDEVDSILIDEARTPLIISGPADDLKIDRYYTVDKVIPGLQVDIDYILDEEDRAVSLTDEGIDEIEKRLELDNLFSPMNIDTLHHVNQALRAHTLYKRDRDYVIRPGKAGRDEVIIVDPFTGRLMPGRRWSDGLHQAVEAKERIEIEKENVTLATITYQKYFLKYDKLSDMTGTADTEATEFENIYEVNTTVIPTNRPIVRDDREDVVYKSEIEKFEAVAQEIRDTTAEGRPVLVGTVSVEKSELLHRLLTKMDIDHNVLNAKHHMTEAMIVAQAGRPGTVTISTNMAGRGTDILLGGNAEYIARAEVGQWEPDKEGREDYDKRLDEVTNHYVEQCAKDKQEVLAAGGLHIIGTERHESRRIDNQLRGRAGRQGDPGSSQFFLSLEDDLLRIFGSDRLKGLMERLGMEDGEPLVHPWLSKAVENAQGKVEGRNYGIRKNLLEYDEVMSQQRDAVYGMRKEVIQGQDTRSMVLDMAHDLIMGAVQQYSPDRADPKDIQLGALNEELTRVFHEPAGLVLEDLVDMSAGEVTEKVMERVTAWYSEKEELIGPENLRYRERYFLLTVIDSLWKSHLQAMDHLRGGVGLRGYAQRDPLLEYKREGFAMFQMMLDIRDTQVVERLWDNLSHERALTDEENAALLAEQERKEREAAAAATAMANQLGGGSKSGGSAETMAAQAAIAIRQRQAARGAASAPARPAQRPITQRRTGDKLGRNAPCHCGSGKKYKNCHMKEDQQAEQA